MQKFATIDCICANDWGLSLPEAYLFAWMYRVPAWAKNVTIEGVVYFFAAKSKAVEDLPLLTKKIDTMYRYYKSLQEKGLIDVIKIADKDYIKLTEKGKEWQSERSDKNPSGDGQESEQGSDKNPTYRKKKNTDSETDRNKDKFSKNENLVSGFASFQIPVEENPKPIEAPADGKGKEGKPGGRAAGAEKPKRVKKVQPSVVFPEHWEHETKEALKNWLDYKTLKGDFYLEVSLTSQIRRLDKHSEPLIRETIEESIAQGWRGLFPKTAKDKKPERKSLKEMSLEILKENLEKIGFDGTEQIHPSLREWDGNE